jgi:GNAT superfamily N-acetyltransferase
MEDAKVRAPEPNDFDGIFLLLRQLWPDKALHRDELYTVFRKGLDDGREKYLVAICEGRIVGFASLTIKNNLWQEGNLGHVDELIVEMNYRGRGIGMLLLNRIIDLAKEQQCRRIELDSSFERSDAHDFYESHGFEKRAYLFSKIL